MIKVWLQKHDFTSSEDKEVSFFEFFQEFERLNLKVELSRFEEGNDKHCSPGMGIMFEGSILHIMPKDTNVVRVFYDYPKQKKLFGLLVYTKPSMHHIENFLLKDLKKLITIYLNGNRNDILNFKFG